MNLIPFVGPPSQEDYLERLGGENILFPPAALKTLERFGEFWPDNYSEVYYGNIKQFIDTGFFKTICVEEDDSIHVDVEAWCFLGGGYRSFLDLTDPELDHITAMHNYFLNTN